MEGYTFDFWKFATTFLIPFGVAFYSGVLVYRLRQDNLKHYALSHKMVAFANHLGEKHRLNLPAEFEDFQQQYYKGVPPHLENPEDQP